MPPIGKNVECIVYLDILYRQQMKTRRTRRKNWDLCDFLKVYKHFSYAFSSLDIWNYASSIVGVQIFAKIFLVYPNLWSLFKNRRISFGCRYTVTSKISTLQFQADDRLILLILTYSHQLYYFTNSFNVS